MDKKVYYINMHNNINKLAAYNINIEGDYLCPLCLKAYKEQDVRNVLTEEDVPQHSLGGKRIVLTCKNCNSTCGFRNRYSFIKCNKIERTTFIPS